MAEPARRFEPQPETPAARAAGRLSLEYVLRALQLIAGLLDGDLVLGIVAVGVIVANTGYLDRPRSGQPAFAGLDEMPPDEARKPITVHALAESLGMPYETTRRYVKRLIALGVCQRAPGGIVAPASALGSQANDAALLANLANLRRLYRNLGRLGVDLD